MDFFGLEFKLEDCPRSFLDDLPRGERVEEGGDVYFVPFELDNTGEIAFQIERRYRSGGGKRNRRFVSVLTERGFREVVQPHNPQLQKRGEVEVSSPSEGEREKQPPHPTNCRCTMCATAHKGGQP